MLETIPHPLPQRFFTDSPGIGGRIKVEPEDFLVDEIELTEPSEAGEHLYLRVRTVNLGHGQIVSMLARHFGVPRYAIGFAGMKDKRSISSQAFTVLTPRNYEGERIGEGLEVQWVTRHYRKLRRGHLVGNRFSIRIREVDPLRAPQVARTLRTLEASGVPNYFGPQRFGYRRNNHIIGIAVLKREWQCALDELLGPHGSPFPEHQRESRGHYAAGRYVEAMSIYGRGSDAELAVLRALAEGANPRRAILRAGRQALSFWVNAAQSAVFNRVLDDRIAHGDEGGGVRGLSTLRVGDLAWKHDSRAVFRVDEPVLADPETDRRLRDFEISPSGPIWSPGMTRARGEVDDAELAALRAFSLEHEDLDDPPCRLEGARRPLRVPLGNTQVDGGLDVRGRYIRVAFDLPRGAYATVVLREIMKRDDLEQPVDTGDETDPTAE